MRQVGGGLPQASVAPIATVRGHGKVIRRPDVPLCSECGWRTTKWSGPLRRVPGVGNRRGDRRAGPARGRAVRSMAQVMAVGRQPRPFPIAEVDSAAARARPTGLDELDRVLGGGLVPGRRRAAGRRARGRQVHAAAGGGRARRGAGPGAVRHRRGVRGPGPAAGRPDRRRRRPTLYLAAETDLAALLGHVEAVQPRLLIVDSVQTIAAAGVDGTPGGVTQVREVTAALIARGQAAGMTTVLVGPRDQGRRDRRARGRWSTWSTWCCISRATGTRQLRHGPGAEEPVRPDRRGRLLRAAGERHRSGCPTRAGCSCPGAPSRCPAPA